MGLSCRRHHRWRSECERPEKGYLRATILVVVVVAVVPSVSPAYCDKYVASFSLITSDLVIQALEPTTLLNGHGLLSMCDSSPGVYDWHWSIAIAHMKRVGTFYPITLFHTG